MYIYTYIHTHIHILISYECIIHAQYHHVQRRSPRHQLYEVLGMSHNPIPATEYAAAGCRPITKMASIVFTTLPHASAYVNAVQAIFCIVATASFPISPIVSPHSATIATIMDNSPTVTLILSIQFRICAGREGPLRSPLSLFFPVPTPLGLASSAVAPSVMALNVVCSPKPNPLPLSNSCMPANAAAAVHVWPAPSLQLLARFPRSVAFYLPRLWPPLPLPYPPLALCCEACPISSIWLPLSYLVCAPNCISKLFVDAGLFGPSAAI